VHVFTRGDAREGELERLEGTGARVHPVAFDRRGLSMEAVLSMAWDLGIRSILCEGGARLSATLLGERVVRRLYLFIAPVAFGEEGVAAFPGVARDVWERFRPACPPELLGRDTLLVLDLEEE